LNREVSRGPGEQWGVLSRADLGAGGWNDKAIAVRLPRGWVHRLHRGVYAVGHTSVSLEGRFLAAVKWAGAGAVLSHHSAAALWGILAWEDRDVEITLAGTGRRSGRGIRTHRTRLTAEDRTRRSGVPVTTPARTLVDLASYVTPPALRRATRQAETLRLASVPQIVAAMTRAGRWRGRQVLADIVASGPAPTRSELEDVVLDLIRAGGLAPPDVNVPLELAGRRVVPDFRWPAQRLVVEADGAAWHEHRQAREEDAERQALLECHGERVLRVTWAQAVSCPAETLARLRAAGAPAATPHGTKPRPSWDGFSGTGV